MPKKNDNIVGRPEGPIVGGGHQTPEQAALMQQAAGGKTDAERSHEQAEANSSSRGRMEPAIGGSSQGQSDQQAARSLKEDRKVAGGLYDTERTHGAGETDRPS